MGLKLNIDKLVEKNMTKIPAAKLNLLWFGGGGGLAVVLGHLAPSGTACKNKFIDIE